MKKMSPYFALFTSTLLLTAGCGGQNDRANDFIEEQGTSSSNSSPAITEQGQIMQRNLESYTYDLAIEEVLPAIYNGTMDTLLHSQYEQPFYDERNRLTRLLVTAYPGYNSLEDNIIPADGAAIFEMRFNYNGAVAWQTSEVTAKYWGFWWPGDNGQLTQEIQFLDQWENDNIVGNTENYTLYRYNDDNLLESIDTFSIDHRYQLNTEGYRRISYSTNSNTPLEETQFQDMTRTDGVHLDTLTFNGGSYLSYQYGNAGELLEHSSIDSEGQLRQTNVYQFLTINDQYYRINDQTSFSFLTDENGNITTLESKRTMVALYAQATCNKGSLHLLKMDQPQWFRCLPAAAW